MAKVVLFGNTDDFTVKFGDLNVGTYFKYQNDLFVKIHNSDDFRPNTFSFVDDDTTFFKSDDKVQFIPTKEVRITAGGRGA